MTGDYTIHTEQDVTDRIDLNRAIHADHDERARYPGDGIHRVASIPMSLFMQLQKEGVADDPAAFKKWLNDPDNRFFRTRPGRV